VRVSTGSQDEASQVKVVKADAQERGVTIDSIRSGLAELPADQQNSEWANEYRQVLEKATGQADRHSGSQSE
jgi:hypothetical protein